MVWIYEQRKPVLGEERGHRERERMRRICASLDIEIIKGNIRQDHVHPLVSEPPKLSVSKLVQRMKAVTTSPVGFGRQALNPPTSCSGFS